MNKSIIPSLVTIGGTVISLFSPQIQTFVAAHPQSALAVAGVYALIKGFLPSPISK